jgi:HAD superfamily hydrolase (TIGR01509 family)
VARFDLVIFDCDGVLVDSEELVNQVFADLLNEHGARVTLDYMFEHFVGYSMAHCMGLVRELLGRQPPADFEQTLRERSRAALSAGLRPVPGIVDALSALRVPCCVASSGDHEKMRTTLGITGLLGRFEGRLFSVTEVPRGKPFPDVFLHAARTMNVRPERTAVVEDTPVGAEAGAAAGMTVFGYAARTPPARLRAAGAVVFTDMSLLPQLLE